jgi:RNA polymerase sigma-70 factor (ECF subfamily)
VVLSHEELSRVRSVLFLNGLRGPDLEDAAQDVQVRLLERAPDDLRNPVAWACTVATRIALDRHRRTGTRTRLLSVLRERWTDAPASDQATVVAVRAALRQLEPDLRAVVVLRYFADFDVPAIARALDVPVGTVKSRLHRATPLLRAALSEED